MTLPTDEEIWERVRAFAADCKAKNTPVRALKKGGLAHLHPDPRLIGLRYATGS